MDTVRHALRRLKPFQGVLKWTAAIALLGWLFYKNVYQNRGELEEIAARGLSWAYCLAALALGGASILLTFVRWYLLVWAQEFDFRFRDACRLGFVGFLLNYAAPGQVGGDLFKAVLIAREQRARRMIAVATVFLDRILGLLALFMVGAVVSLFLVEIARHNVLRTISWVFWSGSAAGLVAVVLLLHPAVPRWRLLHRLARLPLIGRLIAELADAMVLYQSKRMVIVVAVAMSVAAHLGIMTSFYFCSQALRLGEAAPPYAMHLLIVPAAEIGASLVPLPGGVGVLEGALAYFYGLIASGATVELARAGGLLTALLFRLLTLLIGSVGFGYYVSARREIDEAVKAVSDEQGSGDNG